MQGWKRTIVGMFLMALVALGFLLFVQAIQTRTKAILIFRQPIIETGLPLPISADNPYHTAPVEYTIGNTWYEVYLPTGHVSINRDLIVGAILPTPEPK